MQVTLIAAFDENKVIGNDGGIPWDIPEEQSHFYRTTIGHPVIVGRKTRENIGELQARLNIVLSREERFGGKETVTARNKQAALEAAEDSYKDEVFIIGGSSVYKQFIDDADKMILTKIDGEYEGDRYFPEFSLDDWEWKVQHIRNKYTILEYERR